MSRKKLTNNESFIFSESDIVNPIRSRALSDRSSVQRRLFPKSEHLEAPRNPPVAPHNNLVPISQCSYSQVLSHDHKLRRAGPAGDHNVTKNTATTDPGLELGLNVTKNTATTDPSLEAIMSKLANLDTGSLQATSTATEAIISKLANLDTGSLQATSAATDAAQSKSTSIASKSKPAPNKRVLLQVVPKSAKQNNNWNTENDLHKSKATSNNNETGAMAKKPQISSERGTFLAGSAAADEELQKRDFNENKQDNPETCICLRPLKLILCPVCGYTTTGRIRKTCEVHPKDLYLLDVDACPRCKETNKCVFVEYDLPEGFKQAVNKTIS